MGPILTSLLSLNKIVTSTQITLKGVKIQGTVATVGITQEAGVKATISHNSAIWDGVAAMSKLTIQRVKAAVVMHRSTISTMLAHQPMLAWAIALLKTTIPIVITILMAIRTKLVAQITLEMAKATLAGFTNIWVIITMTKLNPIACRETITQERQGTDMSITTLVTNLAAAKEVATSTPSLSTIITVITVIRHNLSRAVARSAHPQAKVATIATVATVSMK